VWFDNIVTKKAELVENPESSKSDKVLIDKYGEEAKTKTMPIRNDAFFQEI